MTAQARYFGFEGFEGMLDTFRASGLVPRQDADVLLASYSQEDYEGHAFVLFRLDGKLYEVNGSHCSCNGLEECWSPEETSVAAILMRPYAFEDKDARAALLLALGSFLEPERTVQVAPLTTGRRAIRLDRQLSA